MGLPEPETEPFKIREATPFIIIIIIFVINHMIWPRWFVVLCIYLLLFIIGCLLSESHLIADFVLDWKSPALTFEHFLAAHVSFPLYVNSLICTVGY